MAKKMLIVGIGDYPTSIPKLEAAVKEALRWWQLLTSTTYGFPDELPHGRLLLDRQATKKAIHDELEILLSDIDADSEVVVVFIGHGTTYQGRQGLVAYPVGSGDDLITFEDFAALLDAAPHVNADVTFIIDSCFAGGFSDEDIVTLYVDPQALRLNISIDQTTLSTIEAAGTTDTIDTTDTTGTTSEKLGARIADLAFRCPPYGEGDAPPARPVVLAASRENESAFQVRDGYTVRTLFSLRAIDRLQQRRDTFNELVDFINPLRKGYGQHAEVHGSGKRRNEQFPGDPPVSTMSKRAPGLVDRRIRTRIFGLGCFVPRERGSRVNNRLICPRDTITLSTDKNHHFAFVEIQTADIDRRVGDFLPPPYTRDSVEYVRYDLTQHRVQIVNVPNPDFFRPTQSFNDHVPEMPKVCPELAPDGQRAACFLSYPVPQYFSAFFEVVGDVDTEEILTPPTQFVDDFGSATLSIATPKSVILATDFTGDLAVLQIATVDGANNALVWLKPGAVLRAGNARQKDIDGDHSGVVDPTQFDIFYSLAEDFPYNPARPLPPQVPVDACSVTKWP